jgi:hypothetical protein
MKDPSFYRGNSALCLRGMKWAGGWPWLCSCNAEQEQDTLLWSLDNCIGELKDTRV